MERIWNFFLLNPLLSSLLISSIILLSSVQSINSQFLNDNPEIYDVVVIGGGVSGCYCAWRIAENDFNEKKKSKKVPRTVHLYEMSGRIGGRLYTVFLPGMPHVPVELGGMRFRTNQLMTYELAKQLDLKVVDFSPVLSDNLYYLRGERFRAHEISNSRIIPYELSPLEEGKTPYELIIYAIEHLIPNFRNLTCIQCKEGFEGIKYQGKSLENTSWQNFLSSVLSPEAFQLLIDTGTVQLINNVSAASEILHYVSQPSYRTVKIASGYQDLPTKLSKKFESRGGKIHKEYKLRSIEKAENYSGSDTIFRLIFNYTQARTHDVEVYARNVILAMPKRSLELLDKESVLFQNKKFKDNLDTVSPYPFTNLFFGYADPWWRKLGLQSGDSISDFELRTTLYFGTEEEAPNGDPANTNALLLASFQGARVPFWKGFALGDTYKGLPNNFVPIGKESVNKKIGISNFAVFQAQRMLKVLHGMDIPDPYTVAYFDWSKDPFGGAYYQWKVGVNPDSIAKKMHKPISDLNIFICGDTYSDMQGWVEGALRNSELLLEENFGLKRPDWLDDDYALGP